MSQAEEWKQLLKRQMSSMNFMALVAQRDYLERHCETFETRRMAGELDADSGKGFVSEAIFSDGSKAMTSEIYLTDEETRQIAFEKRPQTVSA